MFNAQYYSVKKQKLSNDLIRKMESTLINIGNHLNEFTEAKNKFNEEIIEIQNIEKENAIIEKEKLVVNALEKEYKTKENSVKELQDLKKEAIETIKEN